MPYREFIEWLAWFKLRDEPPKMSWKQQQHAMMMHAKITKTLVEKKRGG